MPVLSSEPDKAMKQEAIRHKGGPFKPHVQRWIDTYALQGRDPPKTTYYERRRGELAVKKARADALMEARTRALKSGARRWPKLREAREYDKENAMRADQQKQAEAEAVRAAAKEVLVAKELRAAAEARVSTLMRLRGNGPHHHETSAGNFFPVALPNFAVVDSTFLMLATNLPFLYHASTSPPDLCWEIALLSTPGTRALLLSLCRTAYTLIVPLVYSRVSVGDRANRLVRTLASRPELPHLVQSLEFCSSLCARVDSAEWAQVLPALKNLRRLVTSYYVPLESHIVPQITFRLTSFTAFSVIIGPWVAFIAMQAELEELVLHADFLAAAPSCPVSTCAVSLTHAGHIPRLHACKPLAAASSEPHHMLLQQHYPYIPPNQ
ncbi:hypothetical protein B0H19DRAFT_1066994 [Mycena capillaripes]|nr:hypothetical protein B0H19DRAFT_1066994 [Mycena capillaripes]